VTKTGGDTLAGSEGTARPARVVQGGRAKVYRPMAAPDRATALEAALAAYGRGDFFLAHELLEPAWMGAADPAERDLYQGLIKLSAGYVHAVRGNPSGVANNLRGARERLAAAAAAADGPDVGLDLGRLLAAVDDRLAGVEALAAATSVRSPRRPGEAARAAVPLGAPVITRTLP
jgi:predicted metal-dependent hydrolase